MLSNLLAQTSFAVGITAPIFVMVILGALLKKWGLIEASFMDQASRLVYLVALPALLFVSIVKTDIETTFNIPFLLLAATGTFIGFILLSVFAAYAVENRRDRGVFVQGAFRGNLAIVGLALCSNAYGAPGLAVASVLLSVIVLLYNLLSVYTLNASLREDSSVPVGKVFMDLVKNPLIIAIALGLLVNFLSIPIHGVIIKSGSYLAQMTLPLALICIGGTISFQEFRSSTTVAFYAVLAKLVITPLLIVGIAILFGISGMELGVLFLMAATPSAAAGFVMVQAMGGNAGLAGSIVVVSTLLSMVTISIGLVILELLNLI